MATSDIIPRVSTFFHCVLFQTIALLLNDYSSLLLKPNATKILVDQYLGNEGGVDSCSQTVEQVGDRHLL